MLDAQSIPLAEIDVSDLHLWQTDTHLPLFERLRREDPVHWCESSAFGPYWSVTRFNDIMAVDTNHRCFSSEAALGGITILDQGDGAAAADVHRDGSRPSTTSSARSSARSSRPPTWRCSSR